jgi:hypothetical protein
MVCKQCGSYCDAGASSCPVCGAPLPEQAAAQPADTSTEQSRPNWGFVRSPKWPKPTFDLNAVDDLPQPEEQAQESVYEQPVYEQPVYDEEPFEDAGPQEYRPPIPQQGFRAPGRRFDPQPLQDANEQGSVRTIGSVGDYDSGTPAYQGGFGRAPKRAVVYNMEDDNDEYSPAPRKRPAPIPQSSGKSRLPSSMQRTKPSALRGGRRNNMVILGAGALLAILLIVLGVVFINKNYIGFGGFFRSVFGGSPILKDPEVTEGKNDAGVDCYIITVYAKKGSTVAIKLGDQEKSQEITSPQILLRIPKVSLLPSEPVDGTTAVVNPDIYVKTADGEDFPLTIPINVNVPALNFILTEPAADSVAVSKPKVAFSGTVDAGTTVTVGEQALTVDENGNFSGEYQLPDIGMHTLTVEAKKNGYQITRQTVQVDYTNAEANIEWTKSSLRAAEGDTATVKGTVDPGTTIEIDQSKVPSGVTVGTPNVNSTTGFFSFTVKMPEVGHYELALTVTKDGKSTAGTVVVERAPDYAAYTAAVYKMDYDRMAKETLHKAAYKCIGKVTEITQSEPYTLAKLTTDKGDILFEYHGSAATVELNDNKTYSIFGDYAGVDETTGLPVVYCWFITKK